MAKLFTADKIPENSMVRAEQAEAREEQATEELQAIINGRSWRISKPLRWFVKQCQLLKRDGVISRLKVVLKKLILEIIFVLRRYSMIRYLAIMLLKITGLYQPVLRLYMQNKPDQLLKRDGVISRLKAPIKKFILKIIFTLRQYSMIRQPAIMLLKITGLQQPILNLYMQKKPDLRLLMSTKITELKDLTPRSSQIYSDLQDARAKQKNKRRRG